MRKWPDPPPTNGVQQFVLRVRLFSVKDVFPIPKITNELRFHIFAEFLLQV